MGLLTRLCSPFPSAGTWSLATNGVQSDRPSPLIVRLRRYIDICNLTTNIKRFRELVKNGGILETVHRNKPRGFVARAEGKICPNRTDHASGATFLEVRFRFASTPGKLFGFGR